jgi:hypothetical protein
MIITNAETGAACKRTGVRARTLWTSAMQSNIIYIGMLQAIVNVTPYAPRRGENHTSMKEALKMSSVKF